MVVIIIIVIVTIAIHIIVVIVIVIIIVNFVLFRPVPFRLASSEANTTRETSHCDPYSLAEIFL